MKIGSATGPLGRDCSADQARSASTLASTRQFAMAAGDLHLRMRPLVQVQSGHCTGVDLRERSPLVSFDGSCFREASPHSGARTHPSRGGRRRRPAPCRGRGGAGNGVRLATRGQPPEHPSGDLGRALLLTHAGVDNQDGAGQQRDAPRSEAGPVPAGTGVPRASGWAGAGASVGRSGSASRAGSGSGSTGSWW